MSPCAAAPSASLLTGFGPGQLAWAVDPKGKHHSQQAIWVQSGRVKKFRSMEAGCHTPVDPESSLQPS